MDSRREEEKKFLKMQNERINMKGDNGKMLSSLSLTGKYGQQHVSWTKTTSYSFTFDAEGVLSGTTTQSEYVAGGESTAICNGILIWPAGSETGKICWEEGRGKVMGQTPSIEASGKIFMENGGKDIKVEVDLFGKFQQGDLRLTATGDQIKIGLTSALEATLPGAPPQQEMVA